MTMHHDEARHPFLQGLSKHRGAAPTVMVIFGASGDLTARKLVPAVFNLGVDNLLPGDFHLIGYGRKPIEERTFARSWTRRSSSFAASAEQGYLGACAQYDDLPRGRLR